MSAVDPATDDAVIDTVVVMTVSCERAAAEVVVELRASDRCSPAVSDSTPLDFVLLLVDVVVKTTLLMTHAFLRTRNVAARTTRLSTTTDASFVPKQSIVVFTM